MKISDSSLSLIPFESRLAHEFKKINEEWISEMFTLEEKDRKVLNDPQGEIIDRGGYILFASIEGMGIVGTGALLKTGESEYELTKMGVLKMARGLKAGEFLLRALIKKAQEVQAANLYLLTNQDCQAAIHLYEKLGFRHDDEVMRRFSSEYDRANVAMRFG
jgi:ribosomal protein S18 acetylase RimI-like enzyme